MRDLRPLLTRRRTLWIATCALVALVAALIVLDGGQSAPKRRPGPAAPGTAAPPALQLPSSVHAADTSQLTASCGNPDPAPTLGPETSLPTQPTKTLLSPAGGIVDFVVSGQRMYVETPTEILVDTLSGTAVDHFSLPSNLRSTALNVSSLAVDPAGNIYVADYATSVVVRLSDEGHLVWSKTVKNPTGLFSIGTGSGARVAVTPALAHRSDLFLADGRAAGTTAVTVAMNTYVTDAPNGDLLVSDGGLVTVTNPSGGQILDEFGSSHIEGNDLRTAGPYQFYYPGQAVRAPDGDILTADPLSTIESTSTTGVLQATTELGGKLALASGYLYLADGELYFESGAAFSSNTSISSLPLTTLDAYLAAPHQPLDRLGWGAGLSTPADGNYFSAGTTPTVTANFESWWASQAPHLRLAYSVWNSTDLAVQAPPQLSIPLPTSPSKLARIALSIPAADRAPGPYEVQASLYTASSPQQLLGSTCLTFTVGAPGDDLDLGRLPAGIDAGGPSDQRGIALNSELGLDGLRSIDNIDWADFLPECNASSPSASQCGPNAMIFNHAPRSYFTAAAEAARDGVVYWVQVTGGDPVSTALTHDGWWQGDIEKLVAYYSHPPAGCSGCAAVTRWEPWNEPNDTGWSTGTEYVTDVLAPFYRGVKAADPGATVIGGSTLGVPLAWWSELIAAGGLHDLDVASVHPYPGNNDSLQEWGILSQVEALQKELHGAPMWFTEVGWWGDGDYNVLNQADDVAQAMVLMPTLHVPVWNYYYDEGQGLPGNVSLSLVQTSSSTDDYVKAGALASMVAAHQLDGRAFRAMPDTGIPSTYEATFGPSGRQSTDLTAVWSDGLAGDVAVRATTGQQATSVTITNEWGGTQSVDIKSGQTYRLPVSSQMTYLTYPSADQISISAVAGYGPNLASTAAGATATASSGPAKAAITGSTIGTGWMSKAGNKDPVLEIRLARETTINRVIIDTQSVGSTAPGLRDYTVSVEDAAGRWSVVASVDGQFRNHQQQIAFTPRSVKAVRISVSKINYGGYDGGGIPSFWPANQPGLAFVHAVEIYG